MGDTKQEMAVIAAVCTLVFLRLSPASLTFSASLSIDLSAGVSGRGKGKGNPFLEGNILLQVQSLLKVNDHTQWQCKVGLYTTGPLYTQVPWPGMPTLPSVFLVNFHFFRIKHHFFRKASWSPSLGWFLGDIFVEYSLNTLILLGNDMFVSVNFWGSFFPTLLQVNHSSTQTGTSWLGLPQDPQCLA